MVIVDFGGVEARLETNGGLFSWTSEDELLEGILNSYIKFTPSEELQSMTSLELAQKAVKSIKPGTIVSY